MTASQSILEKLDALRTELVEMAFTLECRGHIDAADVAIITSVRVAELCEEIAAVPASAASRESASDHRSSA